MNISDNTENQFAHFVITLFNLKNFLDGSRDEDIWREWTINRIEVFKTYCLPSMMAQTEQNYKWLLYFDESTPVSILDAFHQSVHYGNIEIILKSGFDTFKAEYIEDIIKRTPQAIDWVIETRFDNDDILHKDAIKTIQWNSKSKDGFLISLSSGFTYQLNTGYLSHYYYPMGPFLSIIENKKAIKGIYLKNHWQWSGLRLWIYKELLKILNLNHEKVHFVLRKDLWIQLIHGSNMHNTSDRGFPVFTDKKLDGFNVALNVVKSPISRIMSHIHYVWWKRYLKAEIVLFIRFLFLKKD